jgi:hypothetical protein
LQKRFKELLSEINNLEPLFVDKVAHKHMKLTKWIHSINLLRWYGMYQNKGNYNAACVIDLKNALAQEYRKYKNINKYIINNYPTADMIKKSMVKMNKKPAKAAVNMNNDIAEEVQNPIVNSLLRGQMLEFKTTEPQNI